MRVKLDDVAGAEAISALPAPRGPRRISAQGVF